MLRCPFFLWFFNLKHPPITLCSLCQGQKVEKTVTFYQHKCLFIYRVHKATPLPPPPLFLGGEIFEKSREVQDFLVKIKGDPYRVTGCLKGEGGKYFFSMYGFCNNNALYSASLLFKMFIFLLTSFETWDCHYFGSNLSLVSLIKVLLIKKHALLFCSLFNMK